MKKQLLLFFISLGASLPLPMLAIRTEYEDFRCVESNNMPPFREVGTVDTTLSWGKTPYWLTVNGENESPRLATSHLSNACYLAYTIINRESSTINIWDMDTGVFLPPIQQSCPVRSMAFSPEEPHVLAIAGEDRTLKTINVETRDILTDFDTSTAQVMLDGFRKNHGDNGLTLCYCPEADIYFSTDGNLLMSELKQGDKPSDYSLYKKPLYGIWDTQTGKFLGKYHDITFFKDGSVCGNGSYCNYIKDPENNVSREMRYAISPRSKKLVIVRDGCPHVYNLENGNITFDKILIGSSEKTNYGISLSPDGTLFAVIRHCPTEGCLIEVWNILSGQKILEMRDKGVHSINFSPNNQQLLYCRDIANGYEIVFKDL